MFMSLLLSSCTKNSLSDQVMIAKAEDLLVLFQFVDLI